jgi:phage baseplate assembly protein W
MTALIPHLAYPARVVGGRLAAVEQDSIDDVAGCVELLMRCPVGSREDEPTFGTPPQVFGQGGVSAAELEAAIARWEPRAGVLTEATLDGLAARVRMEVTARA